jgi:hypothetical protein
MNSGVKFNLRLDSPGKATIIHLAKGAIMNSKFSLVKSIALTAALVAGVSGMARADDNDMSRIGGAGYAYFNSAPVAKTPSAWRQANPHGISERQLEAESSEALANDFQRPTFDKTASAWRQANPHGLSERDFQAMSSEGPVWHQSTPSSTRALASTNDGIVVAKTAVK